MPLTAPEKSVISLSAPWLSSDSMLLTPLCTPYSFNRLCTGPTQLSRPGGLFPKDRQGTGITKTRQTGGNGNLQLFPAPGHNNVPSREDICKNRHDLTIADHGDGPQGIDLERQISEKEIAAAHYVHQLDQGLPTLHATERCEHLREKRGIVAMQHLDDGGFSISPANLCQAANGLLTDTDVGMQQTPLQLRYRTGVTDIAEDGRQISHNIPALVAHQLQYRRNSSLA